VDQAVGRTVKFSSRVGAVQFSKDPARQLFAQFHAPLVKAVNVPDDPLHKYFMLVKRDQRAQGIGGDLLDQERVAGTVSFKDFKRKQPLDLSGGLSRPFQL